MVYQYTCARVVVTPGAAEMISVTPVQACFDPKWWNISLIPLLASFNIKSQAPLGPFSVRCSCLATLPGIQSQVSHSMCVARHGTFHAALEPTCDIIHILLTALWLR